MTEVELRQDPEYIKAKEKIIKYSKGFKFTVPMYKMTNAQQNAMRIILKDCCDEGLIEFISFGLDLQGNVTEEEYVRM